MRCVFRRARCNRSRPAGPKYFGNNSAPKPHRVNLLPKLCFLFQQDTLVFKICFLLIFLGRGVPRCCSSIGHTAGQTMTSKTTPKTTAKTTPKTTSTTTAKRTPKTTSKTTPQTTPKHDVQNHIQNGIERTSDKSPV